MDQVAQIRERIDIVALISEYISLKKMGRNFKTTCPFHNEKTPSFVVSPERQIWHCFGCHKGGDCFTFLMEYENLEFPEALRTLAKRAGITLEDGGFATGVSAKKEIIYKINRQAMEFYHYVLTKHVVGKNALLYLKEKREINPKVIETFMLGFAPGVGSALTQYLLTKKKQKKEDLLSAGLTIQKGNSVVDFFARRIMFPLFDHRGNVIGFSGRILTDSIQAPKYVNTRETLVYHKGDVFFGLNIAKEEIKKEKQAIIMEGEFDVISAFQEGIKNAIAIKGTALTENQTNLIARFAPKVSLCFDTDSAGKEALKRSVLVLEKKGLSITVVIPPNGKDPDEVLRNNPFLFKKAVRDEIGVYDYLLSQALGTFDPTTAEGKKDITQDLLPFLATIENEVVKEHYLKKLANALDASLESIVRLAARVGKKDSQTPFLKITQEKRLREEILEEYLLALILQHQNPKKVFENAMVILNGFSFTIQAYEKIINSLLSYFAASDTFNHEKFLTLLAPELFAAFDTCYLLPLPIFDSNSDYEKEVETVANQLKILFLGTKIKQLGEQIHEKEKNSEESEELEKLRADLALLLPRMVK